MESKIETAEITAYFANYQNKNKIIKTSGKTYPKPVVCTSGLPDIDEDTDKVFDDLCSETIQTNNKKPSQVKCYMIKGAELAEYRKQHSTPEALEAERKNIEECDELLKLMEKEGQKNWNRHFNV